MTTELSTISASSPSLVARFAQRYGVDANKVMATLKSTVFKAQEVSGKTYEASNEELMALLIVADQYKLNPFTKEIYAFPDTKRGGIVPVVSVDGWARIINEHQQFDGLDFELNEKADACTCVIYRKDRSRPIRVTEYLVEVRRNTGPWQTLPRRMLRHKALIQCARIAFGFAGIYDEDEAERIIDITPAGARTSAAGDAAKAAAAKAAEKARGTRAGDVIDGSAEPPAAAEASAKPASDSPKEPAAPATETEGARDEKF